VLIAIVVTLTVCFVEKLVKFMVVVKFSIISNALSIRANCAKNI